MMSVYCKTSFSLHDPGFDVEAYETVAMKGVELSFTLIHDTKDCRTHTENLREEATFTFNLARAEMLYQKLGDVIGKLKALEKEEPEE